MPSFSEMFPSYARFFSKIGRFVVPPRTRPGAAGDPGQDPPTGDISVGEIAGIDSEEPAAPTDVSQSIAATPAPVSSPPVLSADETQILQMYQSWVELDNGVAQAHEDLQRILNSRGKAAVLRSQAQEMLEQAEAVREEAQRIGDSAWRAFDRGFATNIRGFANRRAMVREIDQSRRTQAELQRNVHKNAWEEAERSREAATAQVLKALSALATVADQVERESEEAASLPKLAEALQDAAREELRCAEAVKDELLLLGTEALNQLGVTPTSDHEHVMVEPTAQGTGILEQGHQGLILDAAGPGFDTGPQPAAEELPGLEPTPDRSQAVSDSLSWEAESTEAPPEAPPEAPVVLEAAADASVANEPGGAMDIAPRPVGGDIPPIIDEVLEAAATVEEVVVEAPPAASAQPVTQPPAAPLVPDPAIPEPATTSQPEISTAAPTSSAQDLLREMEEARAFVESSQPSAPPVPEPAAPVRDQPQSPPETPPDTPIETPMEGEIIFPPAEAATPEPSRSAEASPSAAEQLIRDMEAARAAMQPLQQTPDVEAPNVAQDLIRDLQAFRSQSVEDEPATAAPPASVPAPAPVEPAAAAPTGQEEAPQVPLEPAVQPPPPSAGKPAEAAYSGRLHLMFPSTLTQDEMGLVWEVLEEVARGSQILDSRLLSAAEGIQFTVELGAAGLVVENLSARLFGAEVEGLEPDRLKVNWPRR